MVQTCLGLSKFSLKNIQQDSQQLVTTPIASKRFKKENGRNDRRNQRKSERENARSRFEVVFSVRGA